MPYPNAVVGDVVVYVGNDGTTQIPGAVTKVDDGQGNVGLFVVDPANPFALVTAPYDATRVKFNSWSWPTGVMPPSQMPYRTVTGASGTVTLNDVFVAMPTDAVRTLALPPNSPAGTSFRVLDSSKSVTPANTLTLTLSMGTIRGAKVITPGTTKFLWVVSDARDYWTLLLS